ncbi:MAG: hypothetical protein ACE5G3_01285 [Gammaproteobacteria bacterium]
MHRPIIVVFLFAIGIGPAFGAVPGGDPDSSFAHTFVLFLHQLLLVYWLGPDIAVYIWSRRVVSPELGPEQRIAASRLMTRIDIVPRACLALFLTVAGILSDTYGIEHPWWQLAGIVLLGPVWLFLVLAAWLKRGSDFGRTMARLDIWLRALLVVAIPASVVFASVTGRLADTPWITGKLMMLAAIILLGLLMRRRLSGYREGMELLATDGPSPQLDHRIAASVKSARPYVYAIWALLLWAALLGLIKPGEPEAPLPAAGIAAR